MKTLRNFLYAHIFSEIIGRQHSEVFTCRLCRLTTPSSHFNLPALYLGQITDAQVADKLRLREVIHDDFVFRSVIVMKLDKT